MSDFRKAAKSGLEALLTCADSELAAKAEAIIAENAVFDIAAPIHQLKGRQAIIEGYFKPIRSAFAHRHRRDEIFIGGDNRREQGGQWVASILHYVGQFTAPFCGVRPARGARQLAFFRSGEFYRLDNGLITEAKIIFDLPDLMRQAGHQPFPFSYGTEMLFPAPATHDGVCPDPAGGSASLDVVERMLGALRDFNPDTFESAEQTGENGTWDDNMMWYGPMGIGSNFRWDGFVDYHRESFLRAFPDRVGGNHYCRIGDGNYAAVSGWPSMTMTFQDDYLGVKADGRDLTLRVMDFYRMANGRIMENWVMLDYVDLMNQMGVDIIARQQPE